MTGSENLLTCYNKGCGKKFNPNENSEDSCLHHPGAPIFHDAYKGWSCCNKKSTDFTEFLNFKGCASGKHSNEKPEEPVKKSSDNEILPEVVERKPMSDPMKRPDFNSPCIKLEPTVNPNFKKQMDESMSKSATRSSDKDSIVAGTSCKNGGCNGSYASPSSNDEVCVFHPGTPVFHEGYKFWSCCKKRTTDFSSFLSQPGCENGKHLWIKESSDTQINCRWDWHQTASNVTIAVYAKNYDYRRSFVKINPIRAVIKLFFPQQGNGEFSIDLELRGIIDVSKSTASMFGTKVEVCMPKAEAGHWSGLDFPRENTEIVTTKSNEETEKLMKRQEQKKDEEETANDSDIDLDDIELEKGAQVYELGELARTSALVEDA